MRLRYAVCMNATCDGWNSMKERALVHWNLHRTEEQNEKKLLWSVMN